jgi:hypothetical protein
MTGSREVAGRANRPLTGHRRRGASQSAIAEFSPEPFHRGDSGRPAPAEPVVRFKEPSAARDLLAFAARDLLAFVTMRPGVSEVRVRIKRRAGVWRWACMLCGADHRPPCEHIAAVMAALVRHVTTGDGGGGRP